MRFAELFLRLFHPQQAFGIYQSCFEPHPETGKEFFSQQLFFQHSAFEQRYLASCFQDIFSLIQTFIRRYRIDELQNAYVHQLLDMAAQFDLHSGPDLAGFLSWYDGAGSKTNVQLPENRNSIRVMTAHKSKGLEFPVVIIPSLRFDVKNPKGKARLFESSGHFVQSRLTEADKAIPAVEPFISLEKDAEAMDNVNLLYVAFTRPVDRLYFMGVLSPHTEPLQKHIFSTLSLLYPEFVNGSTLKGSVGTPPQIDHGEDERDEALVPVSLNDYLWFPDISIMSQEEQEENALSEQRRFGRQFHSIMEQSMRIEDAFETIQRGLLKGTIDASFRERLEAQASLLFANEQYTTLIGSGVQLDEQTLLIDRRTRLRPDKVILHPDKTVVIDFKTGERKAEHRTQVSQYLFALNEMQYPAVEGYLYYVNENELVEILL
jgi:ATP-dependent exoDNAse (exonuclease V) beta subunit